MNDRIEFGNAEAGHRIMRLAGGAVFNPNGETCIARFIGDELVGGVVYSNYTRRSLELHCAGFRSRWVNRSLLYVTFAYPFEQLGVEKIFARVPESNTAAYKFDTSIGFTLEARIKDVYPDGDLLLLSMYREQCRHLNIKVRPSRSV